MTKRKWIIAGSTLIISGYIILAITPNMFARKITDPGKVKNLQIIAHRGGSGIGLENTLSCIEKGIASGADAIEIDIHLTKDGHLLVCHDQTVDRTTNGKGEIRNLTLDEIRKLRVVDADGNVTDEHLPTLNEVMELVNGKVILLIEIKQPRKKYQGIEQILMAEIEKFQATSWVIIQSFDDSVLENIHKMNPQQRLEKLILFKFPGLPFIFDGTFNSFSFPKYQYVSSFNIFYMSASSGFIKNIHKQGKEVKIWTLTDPQKTPDLPVDGIITDRPDLWNEYKKTL